MCLGGGIPSPANIRLLYPGRRYIRIYPSSSNRDAYAAKSSLSFSSSLCNCECETHETRLQRGQERSSLQSFCFCCRITKLGILMTEGKSRQVGTELSSPVIYSVSHLGRKRGRHCFQLQGSMMHFCSPQLTAPPGPPLQNEQTNSLKKKKTQAPQSRSGTSSFFPWQCSPHSSTVRTLPSHDLSSLAVHGIHFGEE